jgi:bisanhydrobacterioruberin hydratase
LFRKPTIPVFIALLFHLSGFIGMAFTPYKDWFISNTPLNLILMTTLLFFCEEKWQKGLLYFFLLCFATGMTVEMIGVNTGLLFGSYQYGTVMGIQLKGVPLLIGFNWFVIVYCCGIATMQLSEWLQSRNLINLNGLVRNWVFIVAGALLATLFDWLMEPIAVALGFWKWNTPDIPFLNYGCWFFTSAALLFMMRKMSFHPKNHFALPLLLIQILFFLSLRIFL